MRPMNMIFEPMAIAVRSASACALSSERVSVRWFGVPNRSETYWYLDSTHTSFAGYASGLPTGMLKRNHSSPPTSIASVLLHLSGQSPVVRPCASWSLMTNAVQSTS